MKKVLRRLRKGSKPKQEPVTDDQLFELRKAECKERNRRFAADIRAGRRGAASYACKDDMDLTDEQKAEIDKFWEKYRFLMKMDYRSHKVFYNRSGIFDPKYIPPFLMRYFIRANLVPEAYAYPFQNKAYIPFIMSQAKQPETVVRKVEGVYYNGAFAKITKEEAVDICLGILEGGREIVVKPSGLSGGKGVEFLASATKEQLDEMFDTKGRLFVVQKAIHQHPEMAKLNSTTVNTIRMTTFMHNGKFIPLAALIKVGAPGVRVDNYKHGGCLVGVNMDGSVQPWALDINRERITELPSGIKLGVGGFEKVPCFDSVLETAAKAHYGIPRIRMVSWDIAIDDENEAEIIEANFAGDLKMHQVLTGPIFGDMTEEILDTYVVPNFCKPGVTREFDYLEYADHIEIEKYAGPGGDVVVPAEIKGKPVTCIGFEAFAYNQKIETVKFPDSVRLVKSRAFFSCDNLRTIDQNGMKRFAKHAFKRCPKLDEASWEKINAVRVTEH